MVSHYDPAAEPTLWAMPDPLWEECRPLLPPEQAPGTPGRPAVPLRRVLDGILYVLRTGCQWKAVPRTFGSGSTCHRRGAPLAAGGPAGARGGGAGPASGAGGRAGGGGGDGRPTPTAAPPP